MLLAALFFMNGAQAMEAYSFGDLGPRAELQQNLSDLKTITSDLDANQKKLLFAGKSVIVRIPIAGSPWPRVKVYRRLNATAEEAMAVMTDYARHREFLPNTLQSKPLPRSPSMQPTETRVSYVMDLPWYVGDENYQLYFVAGRYATTDHDAESIAGYSLESNLAQADRFQSFDGVLRFEPLADGRAVFLFDEHFDHGLIKPEKVAQSDIDFVVSMLDGIVTAVSNRLTWEKAKNPALLQQQLTSLRAILGE
ncbi:MAG: SRPBCC family protein [Bacteriovoracia bacterium]